MTSIHFKADNDFKKKLAEQAEAIGLPVGTYIKFVLGMIWSQGATFRIGGLTPNSKTAKKLRQAEQEFAAGKTTSVRSKAELKTFLDSLK